MSWRDVLTSERAQSASLGPWIVLGLAVVLAVFAWTTPNHYAPWLSFHGEFAMALAFVSGVAWLAWRTRGEPLLVPWLACAVSLTAVVPLLQWAGGLIRYSGDAWLAGLYLVAIALAIVAGHRAVRAFGLDQATRIVYLTLLAGSLLSAWIAWYQWFGLDYLAYLAIDIDRAARPYANLVQPNNLATLLVLGLLSSVFLFASRRIGPPAAVAVVALLGMTIAATQSRTAVLEIAFAATALMGIARPSDASRLHRVHVVVGTIGLLALQWAWLPIAAATGDGPARELGAMATTGLRPLHWATLLDAAFREPWLGWGWGQVSQAQYAVALDHPRTGETLGYAHNLVLDLLLWNGIPVGVLLTVILATWFWTNFRRCDDAIGRIAWCAVAVVFLHALLEFPLYYAYFALPVGYLMGAVSASASRGAGSAISMPRWIGAVTLAGAIATLIVIGVEYFRFEEDVRRLRFHQARIGTRQLEPPRVAVLTQLDAFWKFAMSPHRRGMSEADLQDMRDLVLRFPSKENMVRYAASLAMNGQPDASRQVLGRVCKMNPVAACESMRLLWQALGTIEPEVASVPWPDN